jgi:Peptidase family M28
MPARLTRHCLAFTGVLATLALLVSGCTSREGGSGASVSRTPQPTTNTTSVPSPRATVSTTPSPPSSTRAPVLFEADAAWETARVLSEEIGPREATTRAYRRAAGFVEQRFVAFGYEVRRQRLRVPDGVSWGVPVPAGVTQNVIAEPVGFDPASPYVVVGAQLDTVPQAPGAEDNGSGVGVMLELARMAAAEPPPLPVVFIAFAAEEPRGSDDSRHHYGSRAYVADMSAAARKSLVGMLNPDRVGVGRRVPVCTGGVGPDTVADAVAAAARRVDILIRRCSDNRASDHWSFEKAGLPAVRLGSTPYPEYHSIRDRIGVISRAQLGRTGRLAWAWLSRVTGS